MARQTGWHFDESQKLQPHRTLKVDFNEIDLNESLNSDDKKFARALEWSSVQPCTPEQLFLMMRSVKNWHILFDLLQFDFGTIQAIQLGSTYRGKKDDEKKWGQYEFDRYKVNRLLGARLKEGGEFFAAMKYEMEFLPHESSSTLFKVRFYFDPPSNPPEADLRRQMKNVMDRSHRRVFRSITASHSFEIDYAIRRTRAECDISGYTKQHSVSVKFDASPAEIMSVLRHPENYPILHERFRWDVGQGVLSIRLDDGELELGEAQFHETAVTFTSTNSKAKYIRKTQLQLTVKDVSGGCAEITASQAYALSLWPPAAAGNWVIGKIAGAQNAPSHKVARPSFEAILTTMLRHLVMGLSEKHDKPFSYGLPGAPTLVNLPSSKGAESTAQGQSAEVDRTEVARSARMALAE